MLCKNMLNVFFSIILSIIFLGCGEGSSSSSASNNIPISTESNTSVTNVVTTVQDAVVNSMTYEALYSMAESQSSPGGLVVDAHCIEGLTIQCGLNEITTLDNKPFECNNFPVTVYLGSFKIGTLSEPTDDKIIFTQDLLGIPRAATMHPDIIKLSMILQSLDEDADISNGITISQESLNILNNNLGPDSNISQLTFEDVSNLIDNVIDTRKQNNPEIKLKKLSFEEVKTNLVEAIANVPAKNVDNNMLKNISI